MVAFHLSFDLNHFGLLDPKQDFYRDPFWTVQRTVIVSMFLLCAGIGQALALHSGQRAARFWRRWAQVVACALLVSAGSALMFPERCISFGVLHGLAVMLLITRALGVMGAGSGLLALLGALALAAPMFWQHPWFDHRVTNWIGLVTHKPATEDYVPVLPWLGVMLWGMVMGRWLIQHRPQWLAGSLHGAGGMVARLGRGLAALGRWPLSVYMLHQPILIGGLLLATAVRR